MESKVAEMVEAQTKDYLAKKLQQMQANNSSPHVENMCSVLLSQMQAAENTVDRKKAVTVDDRDREMPTKHECKDSVVVAVDEVHGHVMDEKHPAASKVDNGLPKKKACFARKWCRTRSYLHHV
eukprot:10601208-Ditylum_brightwellii.AAC.1